MMFLPLIHPPICPLLHSSFAPSLVHSCTHAFNHSVCCSFCRCFSCIVHVANSICSVSLSYAFCTGVYRKEQWGVPLAAALLELRECAHQQKQTKVSFIKLLTHSLTPDSFTHSLTHSLARLPTHLPTHPPRGKRREETVRAGKNRTE